ncbi:MAG: biotin--[acetyl-CoA-carboxylase] ligase [Deltaproteobacteria bacterium]|nr:biotin--[acetyl-CoA-carboxylase] ligase [Deltaproteobacteria bacterium]MBW2445067.1 biotin--[acetyl-CoA-carboxylase] ligase [Deltaproteobacteria bacterium]
MNPGAARVLGLLRREAGAPCSGESLSATLGVSRSQVWKHVETLRGLGYEIGGEPGGGYALSAVPDRLYAEEIQAGLETRWLGREIHWFDETGSTNDVAHELARGGASHGTVVIAEAQTKGRGRHGRAFFSPQYRNLYNTFVLRPEIHVSQAPTLVLAAAVAVADAVAEAVGDDDAVQIKWPNDVLLGGRKASGILMELAAEATRVRYLVLGIGVNLNVEREAFPEEFRAVATSVAAHRGAPIDRAAFARSLYGTLETVLDLHAEGGFDAVRPRFEARFHMVGRPIRVRDVGGPELAGTAEGIDADGALLVRDATGVTQRVLAGDVTLREEPA